GPGAARRLRAGDHDTATRSREGAPGQTAATSSSATPVPNGLRDPAALRGFAEAPGIRGGSGDSRRQRRETPVDGAGRPGIASPESGAVSSLLDHSENLTPRADFSAPTQRNCVRRVHPRAGLEL